jgi:hypothetical protein
MGLLALPTAWRLPFLVMNPSTGAEWSEHTLSQDRLDALSEGSSLIVRSNGPSENLWPGDGPSIVVPSQLKAVDWAVGVVLKAAHNGDRTLPILQRAISPVLLGVISNERRLSQSASHCAVEAAMPLREDVQPNIAAASSYDGDPLWASAIDELCLRLSEVAAFIMTRPERTRCEWGWNGERLWIFQLDPIPARGHDMAHALLSSTGRDHPAFPHLPLAGPGRKMAKTRIFAELGCPYIGSVVIPIEQATTSVLTATLSDKGMLPSSTRPVVVRTDVISKTDDLLLPTSEPCVSLADVMTFVERAKSRFSRTVRPLADSVLLLAPLVPARASAIAHADPYSHAPCDVHAIWGFPDGLLTLPHDVASVSVDGNVLNRQTAYKPAGLFATAGSWRMLRLGEPWDWRPVLDDDELRQLAAWARQVAAREGAPVQMMALAKIADSEDGKACLPFHYTTLPPEHASNAPSGRKHVFVITTPTDLDAARNCVDREVIYELRLESSWLRDSQLLRRIGHLAAERQAPLLYRGSRLSHAFYILSGTGATIVDRVQDDDQFEGEPATLRRYPYIADIHGFQRVRTEQGPALSHLALSQMERSHAGDLPTAEASCTLARIRRMLTEDYRPTRLRDLPVLHGALVGDALDRREPPIVLSSDLRT